jgi:hypothetical protein
MPARRVVPALTLALIALVRPASAEYAPTQLEKIPVDRLLKNLEETVREQPKRASALLNLARAHAMAYSARSENLDVVRGTSDLWFGHEPPIVPFRGVKPADDPEKLKAAKVHLEEALRRYDEVLALTPDDIRARLGRAWLLTQTENKSKAIAELRVIVDVAWEKEKDLKMLGLGGNAISAEASRYLIPLLDVEKDKAEITALKGKADKLEALPRPVTPIVVPLRSGLVATDLEDREAAVAFDADGTGLRRRWTWITRDAAWLVHDPKRSGQITSGLQLFGSVTFWMFWDTGYDALAALDDNHDGRLTGAELEGLALWHDANGNGVSDPGEVKSLSEVGIVEISLAWVRDPGHPDRIATVPAGVTFRDGSTRPTYDLVLHSRPVAP